MLECLLPPCGRVWCVCIRTCVDVRRSLWIKACLFHTGSLVSAIVDEMTAKEDGSLPQEKIHIYSAVSCVWCLMCRQRYCAVVMCVC